MVIRKIEPNERVTANMLQTIAFLGKDDFTAQLANPAEHSENYERCRAAFTDEGEIISCMEVIPYQVMFDGHVVGMAGIGGVATLPEHRGSGAVRGIFREVMNEMRSKNQIFSYLYPFSHEFYRKFGYELCFNEQICRFPLNKIKRDKSNKPTGSLVSFKKDSDITPYQEIYTQFIRDKNLAVVRSTEQFKERINKNPHNDQQYTYMWRNESGVDKSYVTFTIEKRANDQGMYLKELAWTDTEGFIGMMSSLGRFAAQFSHVTWAVNDTVNPYMLLDDPYSLTSEVICTGMNRIVDVARALELIRPPVGSGGVKIAVCDDFLDWNNGIYQISWDGGSVTVNTTDAPADAEVSVGTLAQLVCGYITPYAALLAGNIRVNNDTAVNNLSRLFYKKPLYISDRF